MRDRDRLIALINDAYNNPEKSCFHYREYKDCEGCPFDKGLECDIVSRYANYLLKNGVIVPPCKVGQTVFRLVKLHGYGTTKIVEGEVFEIAITNEYGEIKQRFYFWEKGTTSKAINRYSIWCDFDEIGKSVFLTKEEAEQALKGGAE